MASTNEDATVLASGRLDEGAVLMARQLSDRGTIEIALWRGSLLVLDIAQGAGPGFSLEAPQGVHFTLTKRANPEKRTSAGNRAWDANAILAAGPPPSSIEGSTTDD